MTLDFNLAIQLLLAGGQSAERGAELLYRYYQPRFVRRFMALGQTEAKAQEIANEALLKVVRGIQAVTHESALNGWVWKVANNQLLDTVRQSKQSDAHEVFVDDEQWSEIHNMVQDLNAHDPLTKLCLERQLNLFEREHPKRQTCLELAIIEGLDLEEIAQTIERSYEATKEYLSQCRKQLWRYLNVCFED